MPRRPASRQTGWIEPALADPAPAQPAVFDEVPDDGAVFDEVPDDGAVFDEVPDDGGLLDEGLFSTVTAEIFQPDDVSVRFTTTRSTSAAGDFIFLFT